jgi:hypothetical protein
MIALGTKVLDRKSKLPGVVVGRLEREGKDVTLHVMLTVRSDTGRAARVRALFYEKDVVLASAPAKPSRKPRAKKAIEHGVAA